MKQENSSNQSSQPTHETTEARQGSFQAKPVTVPKVKRGSSRLRRFLRKVLIWLVVIAVIFLTGIVVDHYLRYKPLSEALIETQTSLDQAYQDISDLEAEAERLNITIEEANDEITSLENERKAVQDALEAAAAHLKLLQVLADVSNARLALFLDDVDGAKVALGETDQRLNELLPRVAEFDSNLAQSMAQRFGLIVSGLERDSKTTTIDLELFTKDLLEIEAALFNDLD
jgi:septal ring factor EnvC (AmiA/AmiB activator)